MRQDRQMRQDAEKSLGPSGNPLISSVIKSRMDPVQNESNILRRGIETVGDAPTGQPVETKQAQLNRSTRGQWGLYASHRAEIEKLIVPARRGGKICVLGAGNCNDLDLRWLLDVYGEVHLVDLDADAIAQAARRQQVADSPKLRLHPRVDLTGVADLMSRWAARKPTAAELDACLALARAPRGPTLAELGGPFDVVLSPCVLSQLLTPIRDHLGEDHPAFPSLLSALRARHVRLMTELLSPGGRGVLVTDLFSSASFGGLPRVRKEQARDLMRAMLKAGKFFSGLEPASIASAFRAEPAIMKMQLMAPWVWHLGLGKAYLVYAVRFEALPYHCPATAETAVTAAANLKT